MSFVRNAVVGAVVALVIVAGATGAGLLASPGDTLGEQPDTPAFSADRQVTTAEADDGAIQVGGEESKTVLIDTAHENDISDDELSPMIEAFTDAGHEVQFTDPDARRGPAFNASLRQADVFVVMAPQRPFTTAQLNGVDAFTDAGGRLLLVDDPEQGSALFFRPRQPSGGVPMSAIASQADVSFRSGYVYNLDEYDTNYRSVYASPTGDSFAADVPRTTFRDARAVSADNGTRLLVTGESATLSTTRDAGRYAVAVRSDNVVALGSTNVLTADGYQTEGNEVFVGALLTFLVTGDKQPADAPTAPEPEEPRGGGEQPTREPRG